MTQGTRVPADEMGPLNAWVADIIDSFSKRWPSRRGVLINGTLRTYSQQGQIVFEVLTAPENAVWRSTQQIAIFVEQNARTAQLMRAPNRTYNSNNPGGWLVTPDDYLLVRASLIENLAHEGLHAVKATPGDGCLEEEIDGRLAANAALTALGLTQRVSVSDKGLAEAIKVLRESKDYPDLVSDPTYVPLGGSWPTPWTNFF